MLKNKIKKLNIRNKQTFTPNPNLELIRIEYNLTNDNLYNMH